MNELALIGRDKELFVEDVKSNNEKLNEVVANSSFLVIGGAGSIGQAVVKEIFKRDPKILHVVDISENNMVELVRDIRSSSGYSSGDFRTFAIDCGSNEFETMVETMGPYDYVLNLSALKHVRSEKDPFTLMRMIKVNIFNTLKILLPESSPKILIYAFFTISYSLSQSLGISLFVGVPAKHKLLTLYQYF